MSFEDIYNELDDSTVNNFSDEQAEKISMSLESEVTNSFLENDRKLAESYDSAMNDETPINSIYPIT